jgi:hypothetical protein
MAHPPSAGCAEKFFKQRFITVKNVRLKMS